MTEEIRAALRDQSGYRTHRLTTGATMRHVPMWHVVNPDDPYLSRCGRLIVPETERPAESVTYRCQRPGCKQHWPSASPRQRANSKPTPNSSKDLEQR